MLRELVLPTLCGPTNLSIQRRKSVSQLWLPTTHSVFSVKLIDRFSPVLSNERRCCSGDPVKLSYRTNLLHSPKFQRIRRWRSESTGEVMPITSHQDDVDAAHSCGL